MLDDPGGTEKTYPIPCLIQEVGKENCIVVASTGIAALCFHEGTTAHKAFGDSQKWLK